MFLAGITETLPIAELTGYILAACGANESRIDYVTDRLGHDRRYAMDCQKAREELAFRPQRSTFPEALLGVVKWYRDNEAWWRPLQQNPDRRHGHR